MRVFENVKYVGMREHPEAGFVCTCFENDKGVDWYIERKSWKGGVIAVWPKDDNLIGSWCKVALDYVPVEGQTLYEVDNNSVPESDVMKLLGMYNYDGKRFVKRQEQGVVVEVKRTKEDILADLEKLKQELLSL